MNFLKLEFWAPTKQQFIHRPKVEKGLKELSGLSFLEQVKIPYQINPLASTSIKITIDESQKFQTIIGFGGAFTDAAGINIARLSSGAQENLIRSYFGTEGKL